MKNVTLFESWSYLCSRIIAMCGDYYIGGRRFSSLSDLIGYYSYVSCLLKGEKLLSPVAPPEVMLLSQLAVTVPQEMSYSCITNLFAIISVYLTASVYNKPTSYSRTFYEKIYFCSYFQFQQIHADIRFVYVCFTQPVEDRRRVRAILPYTKVPDTDEIRYISWILMGSHIAT